MHVANPDWAFIATDKAAQAEELEDLVADIKSTVESYFLTDAMKLKLINRAIQKAGY